MVKKEKSLFRRVTEWLHLWLGLVSGIVVFIVCLTAAVWALRPEIERMTLTYHHVPVQDKPYLVPSQLREVSRRYMDMRNLTGRTLADITYGKSGGSAVLTYQDKGGDYASLYVNPYTGEVVHLETDLPATSRFMLFLRAGHRFLWLPPEIGSPVVGSSCMLFLVTLITGIIWWYPKKWTKATCRKSFKIKWNAGWKRVNLDLHNVLGFYSLIVALILIVTGIYYSFDWFRTGYHRLVTGKGTIKSTYPYEVKPPLSDTGNWNQPVMGAEDLVWQKVCRLQGREEIKITYPENPSAAYAVYFNPDRTRDGYYYRMYARYFDQYSIRELYPQGLRHVRFEKLGIGEKIYRVNYEIHVGSIGGLPTRILASLVSLIGASLPVTGFLIWYNRKWGQKKKRTRMDGTEPGGKMEVETRRSLYL